MKARKLILSVVAAAMTFGMGRAVAVTNEVSTLLQKGLFEEEANHNLDAAIKAYQAVVTQTDKDRQFAATAVFRLGECYRKQGNTNAASVQYQRILREFADQPELAKLSREQLGPGASLATGGIGDRRLADELRAMSPEKRRVAVQQKFPNPVLNSLMEKMVTAEQELVTLKSSYGDKHPDVIGKAALLSQIQKQVDDQVDGVLDGLGAQRQAEAAGQTAGSPHQKTAEDLNAELDAARKKQDAADEDRDIKNLQVTIRDNPDLINGYNGENTPLLKAVRSQQARVVKFLLDNKADPEIRQNGGGRDTPLVWAARHEYQEILEMLLAHGANVNSTDNSRRTALYWAAENGFKNIAELLIAHKAEVDARDKDGRTPLRVAAEKGYKSIAEFLAAHGADVNGRDNTRVTPLQSAASAGNRAIVEWLLANRADVNAADKDGWTPLAAAIKFGKLEIARMLLAGGADVEGQTGGSHQRPMFIAVQGNWPQGIKLLLEYHANVNATSDGAENRGPGAGDAAMTPLALAANLRFDEVARVLIDAKADVNQRASWGRTALMYAVEQGDAGLTSLLLDHHADPNIAAEHGETPLLLAVQKYMTDIAEVLIAHGANVNATFPEKWLPHMKGAGVLQLATGLAQTNMVKLLLDHGADTETAADYIFHVNNSMTGVPGYTPLLTAIYVRNSDLVRLLLSHKAASAHADRDGKTPLHRVIIDWANLSGLKAIAAELLAAGADVNARDKNGQTPLHMAALMGSSEMVEFLIAHGADVNAKDNSGKTPLDVAGASPGNAAGRPGLQAMPQLSVQANGSAPLTYQWQFGGNQSAASGDSRDAAAILRGHGGVSEMELSTIRVVRKDMDPITVLRSRDGFENRPTLYEVIAAIYTAPMKELGDPVRRPGYFQSMETSEPPGLHFPDFDKLKIHRRQPDGRLEAIPTSGLATALAAGDCSADIPLRWGDVVELPGADHNINTHWAGLQTNAVTTLNKCLTRNVEIVVKGQTTRFLLSPRTPIFDQRTGQAGLRYHYQVQAGENGGKQIFNFRLNNVVHDADVILASSDLTRVKVRRKDSASGKTQELVFDLEKTDPQTDLWLRDGDVVEIPEKPGQ